MFELGRKYKIKMWRPDPNGDSVAEHHNCQIIAIDFPIIKIKQLQKEIVLNVTSRAFVSAELQPE